MRCAIYTRKSVDEGLDAAFTTLDNQRDYCSAYIASQAGEGWIELPTHYDDGGWSGGNLKRPALTLLRSDIEAGLIDVVVVYKIDRLSRSLRDFANLVAEFEASKVTFVSVTQSFDTGTAMGRLTLNVLLSFAQFERELTGERLRDWFAGARSRGLWTQNRPFGYVKDGESNRLIPDPEESKIVTWMFRRYITVRSAERVADELFRRGIRNTRGRPFTGSMVRHMIAHPVYRGLMVYRRQPMPGTHEAIVSASLWRRANEALSAARMRRKGLAVGMGAKPIALLHGLLFDRTGQKMMHTFVNAKGRLYRYYIAQQERRGSGYGHGSDPHMRFRAESLEKSVMTVIETMTGYRLGDTPSRTERREKIRKYVKTIDVRPDEMTLHFVTGAQVWAPTEGSLGELRPLNRQKRRRPSCLADQQ
ncbi:MAG: recombinase family protein [Mesorhizobium sp.]